ncbi:MAG: nickel/cobalt efflux protein RcnA [Nevskia sp.]
MTSLNDLILQGAGNVWLLMASAIVLGALHGLEPGHSKTMMAAFIVAIRGTVGQAALLGVSAAISHTAVVWAVALAGLWFGGRIDSERSEAWFQLGSALLIILIALWLFDRAWRELQASRPRARHDHGHHGHDHDHDRGHDHDHGHAQAAGSAMDAHERAHAKDIERRFGDRRPGTGQIIVFGLTGGLIPCPAAITVLLLCLQLRKVSLGVTLVLGFSVGLALTMVLSGILAALGARAAAQHFGGFGRLARLAPLLSCAVIFAIGCWSAWSGWNAL